jgi:carbon monoxide dehydrogenase subunit G
MIASSVLACSARADEPPRVTKVTSATSDARVSQSPTGTRLEVVVTGVITLPLPQVRDVLLDLEGFARWFPGIGEWRVIAAGSRSATVHGSQPFPWPWRDRDYVVRYRWQDLDEGGFELAAEALQSAAPAAGARVVRLEDMHTRFTLRPDGDDTFVRYEYEGDPGMRLPQWLQRYRWQSHTNAVVESLGHEAMRRAALSR